MNNLIGIERRKAEKSVIKLNILLADYEIFYDNLKELPAKLNGMELFDLRKNSEEFYNNFFVKVDEIAERTLTIECEPLQTYTNYLLTLKSRNRKLSLMEPSF